MLKHNLLAAFAGIAVTIGAVTMTNAQGASTDGNAFRDAAFANVSSGTVLRAEGAAAATEGPRIVGYLAKEETEQPLSESDLGSLLGLLSADAAFVDGEISRCEPGTALGVRLSGAAGKTELVLDYACDRMIAVNPAGVEQTSYFTPARDALVALAKRLLPNDREIQALN